MHPRRPYSFNRPIAIFGFILVIFLVCIISGCQSQDIELETATPTQTATVTASIQPSPTFSIEQKRPVEWMAWESGVHASIEGLECNTCHEVDNGQLAEEPAWHDQQTGSYVLLEDTNKLCEKCHTDTQKWGLGDKTHAGFQCVTCHNPHSLEASCTQPGCHFSLDNINPSAKPFSFSHPSNGSTCTQYGCHETTIPSLTPEPSQVPTIVWNHRDGHHNAVSCAACHDASGLEVGMQDNVWVTYVLDGSSTTEYYPSHNMQRSVDCNRCHYPGNPWGLMEISPAN